MTTPRVRLRPATDADAPFLAWLTDPEVAGEFNTFDTEEGQRPSAEAMGVTKMIIVSDDGTPIGGLSYFGVPYGPNLRSLAWRIGCTVVPDHRGRGVGSLAQRLLADHLFATTVTNRVEADTDVTNVAERRALERAGFTLDGVVRGAQFRAGAWRDLALYGKLRGDP